MFDQFQAGTVLFADLAGRMYGATKIRQADQFLLDPLQPFMSLPVSNLGAGSIVFLKPVLLVHFVDLGDLRPETPDLILEDFKMVHTASIPTFWQPALGMCCGSP